MSEKVLAKVRKTSSLDKLFWPNRLIEGFEFERHEEVKDWKTFKQFTKAMQDAGKHVVLVSKKQRGITFHEVIMVKQTCEEVVTISMLTEQVNTLKDKDFQMTNFGYFLANGTPFVVYTYED